MSEKDVERLADMVGGKIEEMQRLPDGSGFAIMSMPLSKDHWLTKEGFDEPPAPMKIGVGPQRDDLAKMIRLAAKFAVRASTANGKIEDFDPDAMVGNFVIGMLGYWTDDGDSHLGEQEERSK